ncbi:MAG: STAS domain-containing protein [Planctomycetota bacterium]
MTQNEPNAPQPLVEHRTLESGVVLARVLAEFISDRPGHPPAEDILKELDHALRTSTIGSIVVDLSAVQMISSSGLGALVRLRKRAAHLGGRIAVFGLTKDLTEVVRLVRLDEVLGLRDSEAEAIDHASDI